MIGQINWVVYWLLIFMMLGGYYTWYYHKFKNDLHLLSPVVFFVMQLLGKVNDQQERRGERPPVHPAKQLAPPAANRTDGEGKEAAESSEAAAEKPKSKPKSKHEASKPATSEEETKGANKEKDKAPETAPEAETTAETGSGSKAEAQTDSKAKATQNKEETSESASEGSNDETEAQVDNATTTPPPGEGPTDEIPADRTPAEQAADSVAQWSVQQFQVRLNEVLTAHKRSKEQDKKLHERLTHAIRDVPPVVLEDQSEHINQLIATSLERHGIPMLSQQQFESLWESV